MRVLITLLLFAGGTCLISAQTSLAEIDLDYGNYTVGFQHYTLSDNTRTYNRIYDYSNEKIARPIPISLWYPAEANSSTITPLKVLDYLEILKEEEEWEHLPNEQILNWFYYANTPQNQKHLPEVSQAHPNAPKLNGKFPVVVYAPSFQASSIENFGLCEYLASHGYVVISSPSRGTETRWFIDNYPMEMETQARDVEFLIREAKKQSIVDPDLVALMGFSFGGLSNIVVQNRNDAVKAVVSLDGTERYQYELLMKSPFTYPDKLDVPYLHMAQKVIPKQVLEADNIPEALNTTFQLYDSISLTQAYKVRFHNLTHSHFSTLGVLFSNRDPRQDKSDPKIMESYKLMAAFTLNFLNTHLQLNSTSPNDQSNDLGEFSDSSELLTVERKTGGKDSFNYKDFNDLASTQNYENLIPLYDSLKAAHPELALPEGVLNTLGLQLVFNPEKGSAGISVFLLALHLYPNSANLYDSMAEGYLFLGEEQNAKDSFKKSLELNPENQNAIKRLQELRK
ncbi:Alpha/beta hydrolase family protein [Robiginitalea myxolifaciens]|uniref:Alpha/beta hydrolase family protein n=1 Tax=Robiginitalea myxolifaciens TaxID=400055 RepID=A0A1I6FXS2_9FLAO|nr:prolyl oligopeptidase family serine peptidase [Robiginitalea myxolifaciens]SFR34733.1 Alpha/beta hydrolase family protein [Robiginitalea myxolifaciens]